MNMTTWRRGLMILPLLIFTLWWAFFGFFGVMGLIVSSELSRNAGHRMDPFLWTAIEIAVSALPGLASLSIALRAFRRGR
jgi:hypothetical protein